ncbi:hypothetical protein QFZ51_002667 [Chitinophaga sp. W3I9]|uniref:hypothetical protein n=1 Tax=unclassified Chitinophaga TaxID=2619133 RepID=UPI003D1DE821
MESKNTENKNTSKGVPGKDTGDKTSLGGNFNSGVTSDDPEIKKAIEKKATLLEDQPPSEKDSNSKQKKV